MDSSNVERALYFHNPWWQQKRVPDELALTYERPALAVIKRYRESLNRIIVIKGPRRTGKTTLFYQAIKALIAGGENPLNILLVSFDDTRFGGDLDEIFSAYETIRGRTLKEAPLHCFLDEVHFCENWALAVKKYFDRKYPIKFFVSSSSASLFKKSLESLAGRTVEETILPFSFREFVEFSFRLDPAFANHLREGKTLPYENKIKILFNQYFQKGGFPHIAEVAEPALWQKLLREDVIEKVIYRDLVRLYGIREPEILEKVFLYMAATTAQILNLSNMAGHVGMSRQQLEKYVAYLEQSYLIFSLRRHAASASKTLRSAPKIHLIDCGLASIFGPGNNQDFILESLAARHLWESSHQIGYYRNSYEVDLVLTTREGARPIEIKNKARPDRSDFKSLVFFMKKHKSKRGLLLCREYSAETTIEGFRIKIEPIWSWLLNSPLIDAAI